MSGATQRENSPATSTLRTTSTQSVNPKESGLVGQFNSNNEKLSDSSDSSDSGYEDRGEEEIEDHEGKQKKVQVVLEKKSGKEILKEKGGGPYTIPRWRHSLPFINPKYPPPPPPLSLDDATVIPEVGASFFSFLFFNWISPMMALGAARPLQATDLWRMDDKRSAGVISRDLAGNFAKRQKKAEDYNNKLADPSTPLPLSRRILYSMVSNREQREKDYRTKYGRKSASLAWSLSDTFGLYFWMGGLIKVFGDTCSAVTPLVMRQIINWIAQRDRMVSAGLPEPSKGYPIGMAFVLFALLVMASMSINHFFVRGLGTGVKARAGIISAIFNRALRFTQKSRGEIPNGKLVNHISTDTSRIDFCAGFFHMTWTSPLQFVVIMIILLVQIGYSALPGIGFCLLMMPAQTALMKKLFSFRKKSMVWTDKRAKLLQEILGGMRIVKFMAWENPFLNRLGTIRGLELKYVRQLLWFRSGMMAFAMSLPTIAAILSFITYSLTSHDLEAATVFSVITLFQLLRMPLMIWPMSLSATADAINAIGRLQKVFEAEVLVEEKIIDPDMEEAVRVTHASFTWDAAPVVDDAAMKKLKGKDAKMLGYAGPTKEQDKKKKKDAKEAMDRARKIKNKKSKVDLAVAEATNKGGQGLAEADITSAGYEPEPGIDEKPKTMEEIQEQIFKLKDIDISVPRGSLTAIVGSIGSGKSSLLQGLMGEMRKTEGKVVFSGTTAMCAQTPWIQNATVRENILFGQPWNEERYWQTVRDSCLEPDLELLDDGDGTEIGEKGINLSGGQKQRVNIARAVYYNADIIALDDPLSALDAGVGKALFFNAILGALSGKTRILVTHALHFLPYVDNIILMEDGRIAEQGTYSELKQNGKVFAKLIKDFGAEDEVHQEEEAIEKMQQVKHDRANMVAKGTARALMQQEERNTGTMKKGTYYNYLKAGNGYITVPAMLVAVALAQTSFVITSFWLVWWQEYRWPYGNGFYMGIYGALGIISAITLFFQGFSMAIMNYFASVRLHRLAITRVMFAPQSFFDTTPLGRIMNRFAKDIDTLDNTLADAMRMAMSTLGQIIGATILLAIIAPYFLIAMFVVCLLYAHNAAFYRRSSREFKRIDALLRSSLYSHFSESLSGIATIRSYGEVDRFLRDNISRMDIENRAYYLTTINQRWLGMRLDMLGSLLTLSIAIIVICQSNVSAASGGLGLSTMITVQQSFSWLVRQLAEVENDMVGAERIMHYANELEQEAPHQIEAKKPKPSWPDQGRIEFKEVRIKYRPELPDVLKGLTLSVGAAEKIGVVGRTGAGKSSIMMALFRMSELSGGSIEVDGVDVSQIGLNDLRSGISIIPQDPLLFSGTLRSNIDPFQTKSDAELYDTLKRAHLVPAHLPIKQSLEKDNLPGSGAATPGTPHGHSQRFRLDTVIEEEGGNLSVGERSLVSLARALVRNTKVLVLDEATASVDVETDAKIQDTIRKEFGDRTLLTIAHRLKTILSYDRILVMADGRVEEFDTPENLYQRGGVFTEMCTKSGISLGDIKNATALRF